MKSQFSGMKIIREGIPILTPMKLRVLELVEKGMKRQEIADYLSVSIFTVDTHLKNAYRKLGVNNAMGAIRKLMEDQGPSGAINSLC